MHVILLLLALLGLSGAGLYSTGIETGSTNAPVTGIDESRRFHACYTVYPDDEDGTDDGTTCRLIYPGEADPYGTVASLDGVSPTGLPIPTWDIGGDPPMGNLEGMDLPTMLLATARGCADDDEDSIVVEAVELTSKVIPDADAPYPRDAPDIVEAWYDTHVGDTLLFVAGPKSVLARAVDTSTAAAAMKPATRTGGDLLVGLECGTAGDNEESFAARTATASGVGRTAIIELTSDEDAVLADMDRATSSSDDPVEARVWRTYVAALPPSMSGP